MEKIQNNIVALAVQHLEKLFLRNEGSLWSFLKIDRNGTISMLQVRQWCLNCTKGNGSLGHFPQLPFVREKHPPNDFNPCDGLCESVSNILWNCAHVIVSNKKVADDLSL